MMSRLSEVSGFMVISSGPDNSSGNIETRTLGHVSPLHT